MTEYDPQLTAGLEEDYAFLRMEIESLTSLLREYPKYAEEPISEEEFGLYWLVSLRTKEYDIPMPENTHANMLIVAREVARHTRRLHSKQMVARIRDDINRKNN